MVDIVNTIQRCPHLARHPGGVVVNHIEGEVRVPVAQHLALRFLMLLSIFVDSGSFFTFWLILCAPAIMLRLKM